MYYGICPYRSTDTYSAVVYIHIQYVVTGTTWTFVYKEVAIYACVAAKPTGVTRKVYCSLTIF